jgi:ribosome-binding factor A
MARGRAHRGGANRRSAAPRDRRYPRSARVNEILREVLADTLERLADTDDRLALLTITGVVCDADLRHAAVLLSSLDAEKLVALGDYRIRLQAAISQQVRLKRTPLLRFEADPAVAAGTRVEEILRDLPPPVEFPDAEDPADSGPEP